MSSGGSWAVYITHWGCLARYLGTYYQIVILSNARVNARIRAPLIGICRSPLGTRTTPESATASSLSSVDTRKEKLRHARRARAIYQVTRKFG